MVYNSDTTKQNSALISQIYCGTKEARHKKAPTIGFYLCKAENQAKLVGGNRLLDGGNRSGKGVGWEGIPKGILRC